MYCKIRSIILLVLVSFLSIGQANANFIEGDLYEDSEVSGLFWEFVGSFDLAGGPRVGSVDALAVNGIEAASIVFGELLDGEYALSRDIDGLTVDHLAIYDSFNNETGIFEFSESLDANFGGDLTYDVSGDVSAFINDRSPIGDNLNFVFRSINIEVPEPSTLLFLSMILFIFSKRYIQKN